MIDLVVAKAKTHANVKNVVPFGYTPLPSPPYLVVKWEPTAFGFLRWRLIAHFEANQQIFMEQYVRKDLYLLFHNVMLTATLPDRSYILRADPEQSIGAFSSSNSDGTISQERIFRAPEIQD